TDFCDRNGLIVGQKYFDFGPPSHHEVKRDYSLGSQQVDTKETRSAEISANHKRT
ncbi:hypothetical protein DPMN_151684, partial [Dreissena polymorpha]